MPRAFATLSACGDKLLAGAGIAGAREAERAAGDGIADGSTTMFMHKL